VQFTWHFPKLVVLCLMSLTAVQAQSGNATVTGSVTDPSGAAIDGAAISVRDISTGFTRTTTSNETGNYNLPGLRPVVYTVNAEHQGFRRYQQSNFQIEVDQTARLEHATAVGTNH
jgi:protocatechuate 3,4-dioxygenase beta subunit